MGRWGPSASLTRLGRKSEGGSCPSGACHRCGCGQAGEAQPLPADGGGGIGLEVAVFIVAARVSSLS